MADACEDEIASIERNQTWVLVDLPAGAKPIGLKWIFKVKRNPDGSVIQYKARLVSKGYVQRHGIDYDEVFLLLGLKQYDSSLLWQHQTTGRSIIST